MLQQIIKRGLIVASRERNDAVNRESRGPYCKALVPPEAPFLQVEPAKPNSTENRDSDRGKNDDVARGSAILRALRLRTGLEHRRHAPSPRLHNNVSRQYRSGDQ